MDNILTVPFHLGDLVKDTYELDATEFGAYMRLLIAHYNIGNQGLPDDDKRLARLAGCTPKVWLRISKTVRGKFLWSGGFGIRQRVLKELQKAKMRSTNARDKALKRHITSDAVARHQQSSSSAEAMLTISHKPLERPTVSNSAKGESAGGIALEDKKPVYANYEQGTTAGWEAYQRDMREWDKRKTFRETQTQVNAALAGSKQSLTPEQQEARRYGMGRAGR